MARRAVILGLDTAAGAYIARLLNARGCLLSGTGGPALLADLVVAEAVVGAEEIYDLHDAAAGSGADRVAEVVAASGSAGMFVAVVPDDDATRADVAAARGGGRWIVTGTVWPHETRLGPRHAPGRAHAVAAAAAAGRVPGARRPRQRHRLRLDPGICRCVVADTAGARSIRRRYRERA